jgi:hypothetical protein
VLLGLFSLVVLMAQRQAEQGRLQIRQAAWYVKERATFSDAIASVRRDLWPYAVFRTSSSEEEVRKLPLQLLERFADTLCYAA